VSSAKSNNTKPEELLQIVLELDGLKKSNKKTGIKAGFMIRD
jgi:hypothetical protein